MAGTARTIAVISVAAIAILYQFVFKDLVFGTLGYGRTVQSIKDYPNYNCQRIEVPGLEACEDMWLHEDTGYLYMACSETKSRQSWCPPVGLFDLSRRHKTDRIGMLDTRGTGPASSRLTWLNIENFAGVDGEGSIDLHGISVLANSKSNVLRFLVINHRPTVDPITNQIISASLTGANTTIEQFITDVGTSSIRHVRTHTHDLIQTPNAVQWVNDHAFLFTNDHGTKVGLRRDIELLFPAGNVVYCDRNRCKKSVTGINYPNGMIRARDGLIYVVHLITRKIGVYHLEADGKLTQIDLISVPYPIDNLDIDSKGDIYAAGFPQAYVHQEALDKGKPVNPPTAVFRISRKEKKGAEELKKRGSAIYRGGYVVEKIMEDDGGLLPASTKAVHDPKTGRIFLSGIVSPFIAVCEPR